MQEASPRKYAKLRWSDPVVLERAVVQGCSLTGTRVWLELYILFKYYASTLTTHLIELVIINNNNRLGI